jgi:AcrR family transcriptional regulator
MPVHRRYDDRLQTLLDVTLRILEERALGEITMKMIADEAGISRAWLYKFFPDLASLYAELFSRVQPVYFHSRENPPPIGRGLADYMAARSDVYLDLPVGCAMLATYALNGGRHTSASLVSLRDRFLDTINDVWVEPIVALGNDREDVYAAVLTLTNTILGLVIAVGQGLTTREAARACLTVTSGAVVGSLVGLS